MQTSLFFFILIVSDCHTHVHDRSFRNMADQEALARFCAARERLRACERATRDKRLLDNDEKRTLATRTTSAMAQHGVQCIAVTPDNCETVYVRMVQPSRRACKLRTVDDALSLLDGGVLAHLTLHTRDDLPAAVANLLLARARERGPPPATPRPQVVAQPPKETPPTLPPEEVRDVAVRFAQSVHACRKTRAQLRPLRDDVKRHEAAALEHVTDTARVRVEQPTTAASHVLTLERRERNARPILGIRAVCTAAREITQSLYDHPRNDSFDARLREELRRRLTSDTLPTQARLVVRGA